MERKRVEEEQRIMRERQRIEELERQNHLKRESKEQSLMEKLAKEQQEIENLIKRKEKERQKERLKQDRLMQQLRKREETVEEEFWKNKSQVEEFEAQRQRERAETLRKLQLKKDKQLNEAKVKASVANEVYNEEGTACFTISSPFLELLKPWTNYRKHCFLMFLSVGKLGDIFVRETARTNNVLLASGKRTFSGKTFKEN